MSFCTSGHINQLKHLGHLELLGFEVKSTKY